MKQQNSKELGKETKKSNELNLKKCYLCFVIFRFVNILLNRTWFVPDEYWQSQEVAHRMVFGYGYLTWEWRVGIRSYLYPLFIAFFYKLLETLSLDNTSLIVHIVPIIHALMASLADTVFLHYLRKFFPVDIAHKAMACRLISYYTVYAATRSLTNNVEEFFTICILASMQNEKNKIKGFMNFHLFSFFSFVIRPTSAINLIPIYFYQFFILTKDSGSRLKFIFQFILVGAVVGSVSILVDSHFHGDLLVSFYNFLVYNVVHNVGIHYGTHPWFWYLTQGYPTLLFTNLSLFLIGLKYFDKLYFQIITILFNIFVYSFLAHKEFRFLTQTMPFTMVICGYGFQHLKTNYKKPVYVSLIGIVILTNVFLATVLGLIHQGAPISVMQHLRDVDIVSPKDSILFLTPCHSTPYYSYLHKNIPMKFLTCEPNFDKNIKNYLDEADKFWINPDRWFMQNKNQIENTTHIVMFDNLLSRLKNHNITATYLNGFRQCRKFFHSFTKTTERTDKYLLLMCKDRPNAPKKFDGKFSRKKAEL